MKPEIKLTVNGKEIELPQDLLKQIEDAAKEGKVTLTKVSNALFYNNNISYSIANYINKHLNQNNANSVLSIMATTKAQLENLLELNKLTNVAIYLNGEWECKPLEIYKSLGIKGNSLQVLDCVNMTEIGDVKFKSKELAQQAIDILGEDSIRKALTRY